MVARGAVEAAARLAAVLAEPPRRAPGLTRGALAKQ